MLVQKLNKPWESINYILNLDDNNAYSPTKYFFIFFFFLFFVWGTNKFRGLLLSYIIINIYTYIIHIYKYIYARRLFDEKKKKKIF